MDTDSSTEDVRTDDGHPPQEDKNTLLVAPASVSPLSDSNGHNAQTEPVDEDDPQAGTRVELQLKIYKARQNAAVKAWRSRHALLIIFTALWGIILALLTVDAAAIGVLGVLIPSHQKVMHELNDFRHQEVVLLRKRYDLMDTHLYWRAFETHPKCLVRAVNFADEHYGDLPYQSFADIAQSTAEWAQTECDKIILSPMPLPKEVWYRLWKTVIDHATATLYHCHDMIRTSLRERSRRPYKLRKDAKLPSLLLPDGYHLDCNNAKSFCQVSWKNASVPTTDSFHGDGKIKLINRKHRISRVIQMCERTSTWVGAAHRLIPWMNLLGLVLAMGAFNTIIIVGPMSMNQAFYKIAAASAAYLALESVFLSMYFWYRKIGIRNYFSDANTASTSTLHLGTMSLLLVEIAGLMWKGPFLLRSLLSSFKELYTIILEQPDEPLKNAGVKSHDGVEEDEDKSAMTFMRDEIPDQNALDGKGSGSGTCEPYLRTSLSFEIAPDSSLYDDVQRMREHLRQKRKTPNYGYRAPLPYEYMLGEPTQASPSASPESDSDWVAVPSKVENLLLPGPEMREDDNNDDDDSGDDAIGDSVVADEYKQAIEDGEEQKD